jgi:plasmid stabilization system protein ParE
MAKVVYSGRSLAHIERAFQFLRDKNPLIGRRIEGELRELAVSYGQTGYVALYRFVVSQDEVRILAIRHQRELGIQP